MRSDKHAAQAEHAYVLGHSKREVDRLEAQAQLIDPITERFFRAAGVDAGMRVLDVGSGAGDVAFLASRIVGAEGSVVGTDRAPEAVLVARARAVDRSLQNVSFVEGDPAELTFDEPFDAVTGRYVLQFQKGPRSNAAAPCDEGATWRDRGISQDRLGRSVAGEESLPWLRLFKDLIATLMPEIERFGTPGAPHLQASQECHQVGLLARTETHAEALVVKIDHVLQLLG